MQYRKLTELKKLPNNPRIIRDKQFKTLCDSIRDNPKYFEARPVILSNRTGELVIIAGNQRYEAAKAVKLKEVPTYLIEGLDEAKEREIIIRDNISNGEFDFDLLANEWSDLPLVDWGVDLPEDWLKEEDEEKEKPQIEKIDPLKADSVILEQIEKCDKVIYQFSGGRDSTLAILKTLELTKNKDRVAVHVDTGVEFPDLLYFMHKFCREHELPFKVLHSQKNFFEIYEAKKQWPDAIFRDCITPLINDPCDNYAKETGVDCLLIRGGRKKQKTTRSKSDLYNEIGSNKHIKKLLNPLFFLNDKEYEEEIQKVPVWSGYEKGFIRTACWCCPFQQPQQWRALKEYYPMLWEQMLEMARMWNFKEHPGDGNIKRFKQYWGEFTKC